jgi:succinate dehydrogenase / fumarate reductase membrane anchor subunit
MYRSVIEWYLQRVTGTLLLVLLVAHFWVEHFMTAPLRRGELTYAAILDRISNPYWQAIDIAFLVIALYHGLNGLRNIILDYSRIGKKAARVCTTLLAAAGVYWAYLGIQAFKNL